MNTNKTIYGTYVEGDDLFGAPVNVHRGSCRAQRIC